MTSNEERQLTEKEEEALNLAVRMVKPSIRLRWAINDIILGLFDDGNMSCPEVFRRVGERSSEEERIDFDAMLKSIHPDAASIGRLSKDELASFKTVLESVHPDKKKWC